jgi:hypothetical protein
MPPLPITIVLIEPRDRTGDRRRFEQDIIRIGRDGSNDLCFDEIAGRLVSGRHAELRCTPAGVELVDLGSRNGTFVNGVAVTRCAWLADGDVIGLGANGPRIEVRFASKQAVPGTQPDLPAGQAVKAHMDGDPVDPTVRPFGVSEPRRAPAYRPSGAAGHLPGPTRPQSHTLAARAPGPPPSGPSHAGQMSGPSHGPFVPRHADASPFVAERHRRAASKGAQRLGAVLISALAAAGAVWWWRGAPPGLGLSQPRTVADASRSIFTCAVRATESAASQVIGTAWVVRPGVLATTASVAWRGMGADGSSRLEIRDDSPTPVVMDVSRIELHPGYAFFGELVKRYGDFKELPRPFDVALLHLAAADAERLAPPLEVAPRASLEELERGFVLRPVSVASGASAVGRVEAAIGVFQNETDPAERFLLRCSLSGSGLVGGTPLLDESGRVVGMVGGSGSVDHSAVVPVQRADLVTELVTGTSERRAAERALQLEAVFLESFRKAVGGGEEFAQARFESFARSDAGRQYLRESGLQGAATIAHTASADVTTAGLGGRVVFEPEFLPKEAGLHFFVVVPLDYPIPPQVALRQGLMAYEEIAVDLKSFVSIGNATLALGSPVHVAVRCPVEASFKPTRFALFWFQVE